MVNLAELPQVDRLRNDRALWGDEVVDRMINTHIIATGVGGAGGDVVVRLARAGVESMTIVDPDVASYQNSNRQTGTNINTIDVPKAEVIRNLVMQINPNAEVEVITDGVVPSGSGANLDRVFSFEAGKTPMLLECIGFEHPGISAIVAKQARELGMSARTAIEVGAGSQGAGFRANPTDHNQTFEAYLGLTANAEVTEHLELPLATQLTYIPPYIDKGILARLSEPGSTYPTPASAEGVAFNSGLLMAKIRAEHMIATNPLYGEQIVDHATGLTLAESLFYPYVYYEDPINGKGYVHHDDRQAFLLGCIEHEPNIPIEIDLRD